MSISPSDGGASPRDPALYEFILYEVADHVATITWNRPDAMNAMSPALLGEFRNALRRADQDPEVKVIVFRGAGRAFSAGGDFDDESEMSKRGPSGLPEGMEVGEYMMRVLAEMRDWYDDYILLSELSKPVIAQVHGWCLGGAAWMAAAADITIASDDAVFGQPEVRQGQPAGMIWALAAGWKHALRYSLTGDHLDANEAARIGVVNEVVPRAELEARVRELARRISCLPLESIVMNKQMIRRGMDAMGFRTALLMAADQSAWLYGAWRQTTQGVFDQMVKEQGLGAAVRARDLPFRPEPFGPRKASEK